MEIRRCEKGHYFDSAVNSECPYCTGKRKMTMRPNRLYPDSRMDAKNLPPAQVYAGPPPMREETAPAGGSRFVQCEKGHIYDGNASVECPYCKSGKLYQTVFPDSRIGKEAPPPACVYAGPPVFDDKKSGGSKREGKASLFKRLKGIIK